MTKQKVTPTTQTGMSNIVQLGHSQGRRKQFLDGQANNSVFKVRCENFIFMTMASAL